jgi:hypothetical protein
MAGVAYLTGYGQGPGLGVCPPFKRWLGLLTWQAVTWARVWGSVPFQKMAGVAYLTGNGLGPGLGVWGGFWGLSPFQGEV